MTPEQVRFEAQRGGRFVVYSYCVSLLVVTFRRSSDVYFIRENENAVVKGLPWTLLTLVIGWWGIPWGPIYTVSSVVLNLKEGRYRARLAHLGRREGPLWCRGDLRPHGYADVAATENFRVTQGCFMFRVATEPN